MGTAEKVGDSGAPVNAEHRAASASGIIQENAIIDEVISDEAYKQNHIYRSLVKPSRRKEELA